MPEEKRPRIFIGSHNYPVTDAIKNLLKFERCEGTFVETLEEMMELARSSEYDVYAMDLNLGAPGSPYTGPAEKVYGYVKERVDKGEARFIGFSGTPDALKRAESLGIPTCETQNLSTALYDVINMFRQES